jgi:hypothetical protein
MSVMEVSTGVNWIIQYDWIHMRNFRSLAAHQDEHTKIDVMVGTTTMCTLNDDPRASQAFGVEILQARVPGY